MDSTSERSSSRELRRLSDEGLRIAMNAVQLPTTLSQLSKVTVSQQSWSMYMSGISPHFTAGQMVYTVRQRCGRQLAIEAPTDADVVSTVPESATPAALGYAQQVWANQNPAQQPAGSPPGGGAMSSKALLSPPTRSQGCRTSRFCARTATWEGLSFSPTPA